MSVFVKAKDMDVEFPVYENSHRSLKNHVLSFSTGGRIGHSFNKFSTVSALEKINLNLNKGDRVGLVGANGSGKTTLLRVLSGVYEPVRGQLNIKGKTASLLDLSMGVDPDATGFENIYLRGILEGLNPNDIRLKVDDIANFSELGDYLNLPVRTYSSGMMLRLSFAIATSVQAEILLMDEWLSVGDAQFNDKAAKRLHELVENASILVIASHNPELINKVCNRKITLERGLITSNVKI